jgi:segregation and condensation protein B
MIEAENQEQETEEVAAAVPAEAEQPQAEPSEPQGDIRDVDPLRLLEALLFATATPLTLDVLRDRMPDDADVPALLVQLQVMYENRGVHLVEAGSQWSFQTAPDLSGYLRVYVTRSRKLSRAAVETMAILAYHQPITRAEIEEIRGVALSKGTLDQLFEAGWIHPKGRRETPGRPVTWATTDKFLTDFGLASLEALPGLEELKAAGLLDKRPAIQISEGLINDAQGELMVTPLAAAEGTLEAAEVSETVEENFIHKAEEADEEDAEEGEDEDEDFDEDEDDEEFEDDDEEDDDEGEEEDGDETERGRE